MSDPHTAAPSPPSLGGVLGEFRKALATPGPAAANPNPNGATRPATPPREEPRAAPVSEGAPPAQNEPEAPAPEAAPTDQGTDAHEGEPLPAYLEDLAKGLGLDVDDILGIKHKVKVDGQEVEATLAELTRGYSRQSDYERNSGSLKQKHETFESQVKAWETERQQAVQHLTQVYEQFQEMAVGRPPDPTLLDRNSPNYDPDSYHLQDRTYKDRLNQYQSNAQRLGQMTQAQAQEAAQRRMAFLQAENAKLLKHPAFSTSDKAEAAKKEVREYLKSEGYADNQMANATYADVVTAWKAAQWDKLEKSKAKLVEKKVEGKPKYIRPGTAPNKGERAAEGESALAKRLQANPRDRDTALAAFSLALKKKA